ncbi:hypothetical protein [Botrimarina mediterranea]|uniref:Uncharacterized protein n=1 Tax=Botrimarina mediterranea TaxID=2528022 RepID=A0A518K7A8_9BACT|nr:hypothetical protein [Botrimarina mediterranea]QDV73659.1 hypothetical protein Spa11_18580 [Botrimarina mediterranea]QDV78249.1 hypothetical protein K2D_18560 [Planctomycetes bacterium K2D]
MSTAADNPNRRRKAEEYAERDLAVLRHVLRYQAAVAATVSKRFLEGKQAGHVLRRYEAKGWITLQTAAIPGGVSYATLTPAGGREIGVTVRPKAMSGAGLDAAMAVACFCVLEAAEGVRRTRLKPQEVNELDGGFAANTPHLVTDEFDDGKEEVPRIVLLRVLVAASGKPKTIRDKADEVFRKTLANAKVRPWVQSQDFGLAVVGHTPERVEQLQDAFDGDRRFDGRRVVIGLGPTTATLAKVLRRGSQP